jgi:hypothetical protein
VTSVDIEANGPPLAGAPYTANRKTTHLERLASGATITHVMIGKEARDSAGRTYSERHLEAAEGADPSQATVSFHFSDPESRTSTSWTSKTKIATIFHFPEPGTQQLGTAQSGTARPANSGQSRPAPNQVEKLGTRTIDGIQVEGTRTTRTIPAGQQGNDQPLTITHERWYSAELKLTVLVIEDDPRTGTSTMELSDVVPGEPDPTLFKAPEGYAVEDRTPGQTN